MFKQKSRENHKTFSDEPLDEIETPENFSKKGEHSYFVSILRYNTKFINSSWVDSYVGRLVFIFLV